MTEYMTMKQLDKKIEKYEEEHKSDFEKKRLEQEEHRYNPKNYDTYGKYHISKKCYRGYGHVVYENDIQEQIMKSGAKVYDLLVEEGITPNEHFEQCKIDHPGLEVSMPVAVVKGEKNIMSKIVNLFKN